VKRPARIAASVTAAAALAGGAGVALGSVPTTHAASHPVKPRVTTDPTAAAVLAELARLQARLATSTEGSVSLRARIARLRAILAAQRARDAHQDPAASPARTTASTPTRSAARPTPTRRASATRTPHSAPAPTSTTSTRPRGGDESSRPGGSDDD
jgi:hypothetical protein